jgi:hypothetical protein
MTCPASFRRGRHVHNERSVSLRQRRSGAFEVLVLAGVGLGLGCGDDEPAKDQTVFWLQMSEGVGQNCLSAASVSLPDETARSVIVGNGSGARLVDGKDGAFVECAVTPAATAGDYDVRFDLGGGAVTSFGARGTVSKMPNVPGTGSLDIDIATSQFSLGQDDCTATVQEAIGGALWVRNLTCPALRDPSSPAVECTATIGFIIENCER